MRSAGEPLFEIGDTAEREVFLTAEEIVRYATELGDPNPLHRDEGAALQSRFGNLIASGAHLAALLTAALAAFTWSRGPSLGLGLNCQFRRAARAGQVLRIAWRVVAIERSAKLGGDVVTFDGAIRDGNDQVLVQASGTVLVGEVV